MVLQMKSDLKVAILSCFTIVLMVLIGIRAVPEVRHIIEVEDGTGVFPETDESFIYSLNGEWQLFRDGQTTLQEVPAVAWAHGFGTYSMTLMVPDNYAGKEFELFTHNIGTSGQVFVNGQLIGTQGIYGESAASAVPTARSDVYRFSAQGGENLIEYRVSNFVHPRAGLWEQVLIASSPLIAERNDRNLMIEIFQGAIMIFITFYIAFFASQMREYHLFFFAAAVFFIALGNLTRGAFSIYLIFPHIDYVLLKKIGISTYFLGAGFIIRSLASDLFGNRRMPVIKGIVFIFAFLGILTMVIPFHIGYYISLVFLIPMICYLLYAIIMQYHLIFTNQTHLDFIWVLLRLLIQLAVLYGLFHDSLAVLNGRYDVELLPDAAFIYAIGYCLLLVQTVLEDRKQVELAKSQIITASDETRNQIRNDLHDRLAQLTVGMEYVGESLWRRGHAEGDDLKMLKETASEINSELRDIINGLGPARLDTIGLAAAIEQMAEKNARLHQIEITTKLDCEGIQEWTTAAEQIYLVTREGITNAVVHSSPTYIAIRLYSRRGRYHLHIINDGAETLPFHSLFKKDHGIDIMRYRIEALGGTLSAGPGNDNTFHIRAEVPEELI